jgi:hypothetical protein
MIMAISFVIDNQQHRMANALNEKKRKSEEKGALELLCRRSK